MLHEEFTQLSKVETTSKFYSECIEPQYMDLINVDKEVFVAQWLKENKPNIVKAHAFDIDRSNRELALKDCKTAELERLKSENKRLQHEAETWVTKFKAANSSWQEEKRMAESWRKDYFEVQKQAEQVEPLKEKISLLEREIINLKARLFDILEVNQAS